MFVEREKRRVKCVGFSGFVQVNSLSKKGQTFIVPLIKFQKLSTIENLYYYIKKKKMI